ncbi:hypothetical protein CBR_g37632 [Chara braunii]|uniref:Photolyase/cryptochrome alpha/beta domain-containing protein n=1 Tax=Chara braunii TaxID=69332 RepID=A0A388LNP0_CHABU|nr:hypothetical protein CBR_g37632 [Chara braunii]|eukprot:GBG83833.1 hypothetical protein CBR_g37632 [Chara braunii]
MEAAGGLGSSLKILVLGTTGVGKSLVIDTLLGRKASKSSRRGRFQLQEFQQAVSGRQLHVLEASGMSKPGDLEEVRRQLIKRQLAVDVIIYVDRAGVPDSSSLNLLQLAGDKFGGGMWGVTLFALTYSGALEPEVVVPDVDQLIADWTAGMERALRGEERKHVLSLPEVVSLRVGGGNDLFEVDRASIFGAVERVVRNGSVFVPDSQDRRASRRSSGLIELGNLMDNNVVRAERILLSGRRQESARPQPKPALREDGGAALHGGKKKERDVCVEESGGCVEQQNAGRPLEEHRMLAARPQIAAAASLSLALQAATMAVTPLVSKSLAELSAGGRGRQSSSVSPATANKQPSIALYRQSRQEEEGGALAQSAGEEVSKTRGASALMASLAPVQAPAMVLGVPSGAQSKVLPAPAKKASSGAALGAAAAGLNLSVTAGMTSGSSTDRSRAGRLSAFPDFQRLPSTGRGSTDPKGAPGARKASLVWFRNDLRVHDNEALLKANNESLSILCVYCFDPRDYGKSSSGFDKTGPYRAKFLLECVADLRKNLRAKGNDLVVRIGKPEEVIGKLAREVGAEAVYAHQEVTHEELEMEERVAATLKEEGIETKYSWGSTLYHLEDLPFKLEDMPSNYGGFREKVQNLRVRATAQAPDSLRPLPARGGVKVGEIPTLQELGLNVGSTGNSRQDRKGAGAQFELIGGETEAMSRLKTFVAEANGRRKASANGEKLYGANFSCKISPWLAMGCLSPRKMYEDLKNTKGAAARGISSDGAWSTDESNGLNWLVFELLWRDFFRFITKKYGSHRKDQELSPAMASSGAALACA